MTPFEIGLILAGSFFGGFVNAIAGGGGLVSLPVMLGVFPEASLPSIFGTSKSAMVWGTAWAARSYAAHVNVSWKRLLPALIMAMLGVFLYTAAKKHVGKKKQSIVESETRSSDQNFV